MVNPTARPPSPAAPRPGIAESTALALDAHGVRRLAGHFIP